tara:strand:+ start:323 stop:901 length:579 start_codon:yes stop_codon:yes gene_type:complete
MTHIMIDLETMGTKPNSAILSIGAIKFDPTIVQNEEEIMGNDVFYANVDLESCLKAGLTVEGGTFYWWLNQSKDAQRGLTALDPVSLESALFDTVNGLTSWISPNWQDNNSYVWSHGAGFDIPILGTAYAAFDKPAPWKFWNARDTRTLFDLGDQLGMKKLKLDGTAHNALDDAVFQARKAQEAYAVILNKG